MQAHSNQEIKRIYNQADVIAPDGMPFVRWMQNIDHLKCDQFDATSILYNLAEHSRITGYTFYLYGGYEDVLEKMRYNLIKQFPHIQIVGSYSPPFKPLSNEEDREICEEINTLKPDIICVGLGTPKQDYWIDAHIEKIRGAVFIPSGAIFDFIGGRVSRAPQWISHAGFEWLYRLMGRDFTRLWYRYTVLNFKFLWNFGLQVFGLRVFPIQRVKRSKSIK
jgi:N-acetylglucosaminyldiphosphoundecaprenol N-acetyl-beta-D-mannosaminyltransferase